VRGCITGLERQRLLKQWNCVRRILGRLEPIDANTTRLTGSTSNPVWYAEQLTPIPAPYRIVGCPALQQCARALGERLLAASGLPPPAT